MPDQWFCERQCGRAVPRLRSRTERIALYSSHRLTAAVPSVIRRFPMKRPRVQHVSLPRPPRSDEATRAFYGTLLGFEEIPAPASLADLDVIWYRLGDAELHLFAEEPYP